jgi:hypothetical protein
MTILLGVLLAAAALAVLAYPILRGSPAPVGAGASIGAQVGLQPNEEQLDELLARREAALQALRELNFDRQVGKISDQDFGAFESNLKLAAAGAFRALDEWEDDADRRLGPALSRDYVIRLESLKQGVSCAACGRRSGADDRFCAGCGAPIPAPSALAPAASVAVCAACGRGAEPGDRFCAGCGRPLPPQALVNVQASPGNAQAN